MQKIRGLKNLGTSGLVLPNPYRNIYKGYNPHKNYNMKNKEITTVAVYREDLNKIATQCKKRENFRDKLHEIINKKLKEETK